MRRERFFGRAWGNRYLDLLHKTEGVAVPREVDQVLAMVEGLERPVSHTLRGNMMFVRCG